MIPQELIWDQATGRWFTSPYGSEGFDWLHPHLQALYSFAPHGMLPYTPVLGLSVVGLPVLWRRHRDWWWPVVLAVMLDAYLLCTWNPWYLGVGFGQRGFVDLAPVLALPLAALVAEVWQSRWRKVVLPLIGVLTATTCLGVLAYWQGRIPGDGATARNYLSVMVDQAVP
jgi:hypothetical protein